MANYPTLDIDQDGSGEPWPDERLISHARSGSVKARVLSAAKKRAFRLHHGQLSAAQKTTLETFYDANRALTFTFTHPLTGSSYTVIFGDEKGLDFKLLKGNYYDVTVLLLEV